jgi:nucleotide-binding universal stress UspA family protein
MQTAGGEKQTFKKIMVGVDGSDHGKRALEVAVGMASMNDADLYVFHAILHHYNLPLFSMSPGDALQMEYLLFNANGNVSAEDLYEESGRQILEQAKQQVSSLDPELKGEVSFILDTKLTPPEFAEQFSQENGIDLIVLGCIGQHSRAKTFMGTTATRIVDTAPCTVLVVR